MTKNERDTARKILRSGGNLPAARKAPARITFADLCENMMQFNALHPELSETPARSAVIVYSAHNWTKHYNVQSRSYRVYNSNRMFQAGKLANSLFGYCLDGSDLGVRLDWYKWAVEYCYMEG